jgi:hypothetical protein
VRAHEKRHELETRHPAEKLFRLLKQRLEALARWRVRCNRTPGMEEIRLYMDMTRAQAYQRATERVRETLTQLAPELFQDLAQPWRGTLAGLEARQVIENQEKSAMGDGHRRRRGGPTPVP